MPRIEAHLAAPTLRERDAETAALATLVDGVRRGHGGLVVIAGPAGIGKSRLVDVAADRGAEAGMLVLRARGEAGAADVPFGVAVQLFGATLREASARERRRLLAGAAKLARPLFDGTDLGDEPRALVSIVHGLSWVAAGLAERRPLLLCVDDVQWADLASIRFLEALATRVGDQALGIVAAVRIGEAREPLTRHRAGVVLRPRPLGSEAVASLVAASLGADADPAFCAACARASGGIPFRLGEIVRTLRARGLAPVAEHVPDVLALGDDDPTDAIATRLAALPEEASDVAAALAILGDDASLGLVAAQAKISGEAAAAAAEILREAQLVEVASGDVDGGVAERGVAGEDVADGGVANGGVANGARLAFAHPLIRAAAYGAISPGRRREAHLGAARLLLDDGAPVDRVGAQLLSAGPSGEAWAADALRAAAETALARGAPETAARLLARLLEEPLDDAARGATLLALGGARLRDGDPAAEAAFEEAHGALADPLARAEALRGLGEARFAAGRLADAGKAMRAGLDELGDRDVPLAHELRARFISYGLLDADAREEAERLVADVVRAEGPLDRSDRAVFAMLAARTVFTGGGHEEARAFAHRALGDGELLAAETADGLAWMTATAVLTWSDDLDASIATATAAMADARTRGSLTAFATASYCRATPHFWAGRLADATADAQQALAARQQGWATFVAPVTAVLAWALVEQDDLDGAQAALDELDLDATAPQFAAYALHARGRLLAARGDHEAALAAHLDAGSRLTTPNPALFPWRSSAAICAHALGHHDRARELAATAVEHSSRFGAPRPVGIALRAHGIVTDDVEVLVRAVEVLESSPAELERLRAQTSLGAAWRLLGEEDRARAVLRRALDGADRCNARAIARQAREELVAAGARPRRAALSGAAALTPAERRTAQLAAQGLSNREIAETLFVTLKTVEWHLRHAYGKLGISGRSELRDAL